MPTADQQVTFDALQRLDQGKMQQLGDRILHGMHPALSGLKAHGLSLEGKTTKGVPDSMVGDAPETCSAAVEYTTQAELEKKLARDYEGVRQACPRASTVVLCTNRSTEALDLAVLQAQAKAEAVDLRIVDGWAIAAWLDQHRQDLRHAFLGIPISTHTVVSLIHRMQQALDVATREQVGAETLDRFVARPQTDRMVREATYQARGRMFLLIAPAGAGKTTWSADHAQRYAWVQPVFWTAATDLRAGTHDPIALAIAHAAYGSADPARVIELADLLRREQCTLRIIVDAIDEARDYEELRLCLKELRGGKLGPHATVVLTCREEAVPLLERVLGGAFPDLFREEPRARDAEGGPIKFEELDREAASTLLQKEGATAEEVREIENALPARYRGNALFLLRSLRLLREAGLPLADDGWIEAFAEHSVRDVQRRLREGGRFPSERKVREFLGTLALRAIEEPGATVADDDVAKIPGADEEGEHTLLERAIQAGVLARRGPAGIGFAHALFLEHFAASALAKQPSWEVWLDSVHNDTGRRVVLRMIADLPDPVPALRALRARDPRAACGAAARVREVKDGVLRQAILEEPKRLLASRFPSDKEEGLGLLKGLKWPETVELAVEWFNALDQADKARWMRVAAEVFLSLEVAGAFLVIAQHDHILFSLEFDWYEPSFCRRIEALPLGFREALRKAARTEAEAARDEYLRLCSVKMLAILRDPWLVDYLYRRVNQGPLTLQEQRAAVHLNSFDGALIFLESVEKWQQTSDDIKRTRKLTTGESLAYDKLTHFGNADVLMFPHYHLANLAKSMLAANSARQVALGHRWAEFLASEQLIEPYYEASRRHPSTWFGSHRHLMERLIKRLPISRIKALFYQYPQDDLRADIVHALHEAPGPGTVDFLIERLEDPRYQFSAIQSLAIIGAVSAGSAIHRVLLTGERRVRIMAIQALGSLRYEPALGDLVAIVRSLARAPDSDEAKGDVGWAAIESLGVLGGVEAYSALGDAYAHTKHKLEVLIALFRKGDAQGVSVAKNIVVKHDDARPLVAQAIGRPPFDIWDFVRKEPLVTGLKDDVLLDCVIKAVQETVRGGTIKLMDFSLPALATFDMPRATRTLKEVAAGTPVTDVDKTLRPHEDPVLEARRLLAKQGDPRYEREMVDRELEGFVRAAHFTEQQIHELARWRRRLIHELLWRRVEAARDVVGTLSLLRWFAEPSDLERFKALEDHEDITVADIAHRYLKDPHRYMLSGDGG